MRLAGKIAIITGAAGGQGAAGAELFAREGAKLVLADVKEEKVEAVARSIRESGGEAIALGGDLGDPASVQQLIETAVQRYGRLDVLYNNASRTRFVSPFHDITLDDWDYVVRNELTSVILCCKYGIPAMLERGGSIVNVGSVNGFVGRANNGGVIHGTVKAGIIGLTKTLAVEYASASIRVNVICPGATASPGTTVDSGDPVWMDSLVSKIPLGRVAQPSEIAPLAVYLASDESSYVTGSVFVVDGGRTAS